MSDRDRMRHLQIIAAAIALALTAGPAAVNMVLPLMFVHIFPGIIALLPVAFLEAELARGYVKKATMSPLGDVPAAVVIANIASFVVGAIFVLLLTSWVESIPLDSHSSPMHVFIRAFLGWGVSPLADAVAWAASVLPLFFMSWWLEAWILARLATLDIRTSIAAMLRANAVSYGLLFLLGLLLTLLSPTE